MLLPLLLVLKYILLSIVVMPTQQMKLDVVAVFVIITCVVAIAIQKRT